LTVDINLKRTISWERIYYHENDKDN
jgi:hypothetical protein